MNSTLSGNKAPGGSGGGIANVGSDMELTFCTVYGNTAQASGGGVFNAEAQDKSRQSRLVMRNSLVARNLASKGPDVAGALISGGYNLVSESSGFIVIASNVPPNTDLIGQITLNLLVDPQLRENGGSGQPPWTHALLPGSPAIDRIPLAFCHANGISTDQRGVKRPQGAACDIGAYEYIPSP